MTGQHLGEQIVSAFATDSGSDWLWHYVNEDPTLTDAGPLAIANYVNDALEPLRHHLYELVESTSSGTLYDDPVSLTASYIGGKISGSRFLDELNNLFARQDAESLAAADAMRLRIDTAKRRLKAL